MALLTLLSLCALPGLSTGLTISASQALKATEVASELSADRTFAGAAAFLAGIEDDIGRLNLPDLPDLPALVQLSSQLRTQPAAVAKKTPLHKKGIDATTAVSQMNKMKGLNPAMLGLLTGMYDSWKEKIGEANKKETEQKKAFDKTIKDLDAKKAMYKDKDAQDTYDRIEKYWKRQRSISHRQYHTALKIMHSGMQKFKAVSGAMSDALAGKKPTAKELQAVGMAIPEVTMLQIQELKVWTKQAVKDINIARSSPA